MSTDSDCCMERLAEKLCEGFGGIDHLTCTLAVQRAVML
jgi:hypothetical protein